MRSSRGRPTRRRRTQPPPLLQERRPRPLATPRRPTTRRTTRATPILADHRKRLHRQQGGEGLKGLAHLAMLRQGPLAPCGPPRAGTSSRTPAPAHPGPQDCPGPAQRRGGPAVPGKPGAVPGRRPWLRAGGGSLHDATTPTLEPHPREQEFRSSSNAAPTPSPTRAGVIHAHLCWPPSKPSVLGPPKSHSPDHGYPVGPPGAAGPGPHGAHSSSATRAAIHPGSGRASRSR